MQSTSITSSTTTTLIDSTSTSFTSSTSTSSSSSTLQTTTISQPFIYSIVSFQNFYPSVNDSLSFTCPFADIAYWAFSSNNITYTRISRIFLLLQKTNSKFYIIYLCIHFFSFLFFSSSRFFFIQHLWIWRSKSSYLLHFIQCRTIFCLLFILEWEFRH